MKVLLYGSDVEIACLIDQPVFVSNVLDMLIALLDSSPNFSTSVSDFIAYSIIVVSNALLL
jgi:hypothetical protein